MFYVAQMKAIVQREFGGPDVLRYETVPDPTPAAGQVGIAVHVAGVHVVDTSIREGVAFGPGIATLPMTPGREVAGVVDAIGQGTDPAWLGRRVVVHLGFANGGYASRAIADASACIALADHVDFGAAVAMVGTGRTTLAVLELAEIRGDDVVLITAAAGGIGSLAIQAARRAGALVVGAAGGRQKTLVAADLGAEIVVDYTDPNWTDTLASLLDGKSATVALDGVGGSVGRSVFESVAPGGRMVLYGNTSGDHMALTTQDLFDSGVTVSAAIGRRLFARPGGFGELATRAVAELAAGRWTPLLNPPIPLADAAEAHRLIAARATTGKVILVP